MTYEEQLILKLQEMGYKKDFIVAIISATETEEGAEKMLIFMKNNPKMTDQQLIMAAVVMDEFSLPENKE